tara:strand:- start:156 stop:629 length:474 start_codon:yes stop_codon:yes gene_type:complete
MVKIILFIFAVSFCSELKSNTFSEVFGSEGAAGIENPKTRSLSYTLQYATLAGSIGYVLKSLHDSNFLDPLGLTPDSIENLSKLAYKKNFLLDKHDANIISVNQRVDKLNYLNNLEKSLFNKKYSSRMIEFRNNNNFSKSVINSNNRNFLMERYFEK